MPSLNDTVQAPHRGAPPLTRSQLRALVREWSLMLKGEGLPPEKALVVVKRFVHEAIAPSIAHSTRADAPEYRREVLAADASRWCIEAYFDSDSASALRGASPNEQHAGASGRPS